MHPQNAFSVWARLWLVVCVVATVVEATSPDESLVFPRQSTLGTCRMNFTTSVWTGCADVLNQFGLNFTTFQSANPGLAANCTNFVPGKTYCIYRPPTRSSGIVVSNNGQCGKQLNFTNTCVGSTYGSCCGSGGYCGTGDAYCGRGNCQEGTCTGGYAYSTDGTCGSQNDNVPCPPKFGNCCSQYGFCGNTTDFCDTGCQSGLCTSYTAITSAVQTATPGSLSPDGSCGYDKRYKCKGSRFGDCCSSAGYCGSSNYYCSNLLGCQSLFGSCVNSTSGSTSSTSKSSTSTSFAISSTVTTRTSSTSKITTSTTTTSKVTTTQTTTSTSATRTTSAAPSPTQANSIATNCNKYILAKSGDTCYGIAQANAITTDQLYAWNKILGTSGANCSTQFQAGYYYCVGVSG